MQKAEPAMPSCQATCLQQQVDYRCCDRKADTLDPTVITDSCNNGSHSNSTVKFKHKISRAETSSSGNGKTGPEYNKGTGLNVNETLSSSRKPALQSEKPTRKIDQLVKQDNHAVFNDKMNEEANEVKKEQQGKPADDNQMIEPPTKDNSYEHLAEKGPNIVSKEEERKEKEENTALEASVSTTSILKNITKPHDGTNKNKLSTKCDSTDANCNSDETEQDIVVVLQEAKKPKNCIPRKRTNHNTTSNHGSTAHEIAMTDITPVVVITKDPYKASDRSKHRKTVSGVKRNHYSVLRRNSYGVKKNRMKSLQELELLMAEPTSPIIQFEKDGRPATSLAELGETEGCRETCTC